MEKLNQEISLKMNQICKAYPGVKALDHVDFELRKGEVHALLGENGAGKSTLCKIIAGAQPMDSGEYYLFGEKITSLSPLEAKNKGISMVYQEFNLVPYLKIYENLFLGKELMHGPNRDKKAMISKTKEVFQKFGIDIDPELRVCDLTNAYKQLVEIAKAILENAKVLCMDEPTAPLSTREVNILFDMIHSLKKEGVSVIYISHRLEELFEISDRITVMRDGQYIKTLNTNETNRDELVKLMVGRELSDEYPKRNVEIGGEILRIEHLSTEATDIEDVSFTLRKGEILGFAGLVGAGRTEVMRALFGIDKKRSGDIYIKGSKVEIRNPADAIRHGISLVPEDRKGQGVSLTLSVRENISLVKLKELEKYFSIERKKEKELVKDYIEALSIKTPGMEQLVKNLSGGNQQKVAIAKWLVMDSDIIILDEPTRGIDVGAKYEIYMLMNELVKRGKALIMISSEMPELIGMSDRIMVMHQGRLTGKLEADEITGNKEIQKTVLEMASNDKAKEV
ncbi:sugar ABC transporter ATP-binding protein [Lachnoclostridium sp. An138]|uniref:sugar ABC transporter ATP-binding protein n=1 Tax=Lachnoclostridium sp. An138 TaxID=1965560 RepID=UPI0026BC58DD|nr:sugar ABC transporter ATP-binding protein [Lachnoclostridium sp. An138]